MSDGYPLVSVVIPSYNRPDKIGAAIEAVFEQTYDNLEVIVVDDHSDVPVTNALSEDVVSHKDVVVLRHDENKGASAARNTGTKYANGEFISFLDDDDIWYESKIENQIRTFEATNDDIGVVYSYIEHVGADGTTILIDNQECRDNVTEALLYGNCVGSFSTVMVRSNIVELAGLLDERLSSWQDREWYFRLSIHCKFQSTGTVEVVHRHDQGDRISGNVSALVESTLPQFLDSALSQYSPSPIERRRIVAQNYTNVARYAITNGDYRTARKLLLKSIFTFPITDGILGYGFVSLSGKKGYRLARGVRRQISKIKQSMRREVR